MLITYVEEAEEDLENIIFYYMENVSVEFGLEVGKIITEQVLALASFPKSIRKSQIYPMHESLFFRNYHILHMYDCMKKNKKSKFCELFTLQEIIHSSWVLNQ